jgi:hypothetical protein
MSVLVATITAGACAGGGGGVTGPTGPVGPSGPPDIAGEYIYTAQGTTMACSDGGSIPLPTVSDRMTITQNGNRFTGVLAINDRLAAPGDAAFFEECRIENDASYGCSGDYSDSNATIVFTGGGTFSNSGFMGATDLTMTLASGVVCTWTKQESAVRVG